MNKGVISRGIVAPMIKEGDDIVNIVTNAVLDATRLGEKLVQPAPNVKRLIRILSVLCHRKGRLQGNTRFFLHL